ncbi:outer membrane adhesin like protein [Mycolicibacterium rhodesiae JS60]|nr:outer membrane adhesin like protein [Mycolicibacterium rhodesiae JS60]
MDGDLNAVQDGAGPITTPAQYDIQTTLDAWGAQLNAFLAAPATAANAWLKIPVLVGSTYFSSAIVADRFSYMMNGLATLLNEFVPPFKMVDGAPSTITQASVTAAVLAGAIEVFNIVQDWDYIKWGNAAMSLGEGMMALAQGDLITAEQDPIIAAATGAFLAPASVLDKTIDLGKAPNPLSFTMYIAVVAIFRRFADVATDHQPVVTDMQQTSQHLPNGSGTTVSGYVQFYDADGDPITSYGFTEPNDSRFTVTVVDGTNGRMNWTVWDWNPLSSDKSPKTLTFTMTVLAQGDGQISVSKPYMPNGNETTKTVTVTVYYNQAVGSITNTVGSTSAMGVVRGTVSAPNNPDNPMTYSLVGASGGSAYTANGGIIKLNPTTGAYTYVPNRSSGATTDSFQLTSTDSFGHTYTTTVSVPVSSASPVTTTNPTTGTVTGSLNNGSDAGLLTYGIGTAPNPLRGTVTLNANGAFTYTRTAAGHTQPTQDSFTILGTDSSGKTTTIAVVNVTPDIANAAPSLVLTTAPYAVSQAQNASGNTLGTWSLNTSTWTQTTTGKLTWSDTDGDQLTYTVSTNGQAGESNNGGTVTLNPDGSFSYTIAKNKAYYHAAAIFSPTQVQNAVNGTLPNGASADWFDVTVSDGFTGGAVTQRVYVPIYAVNSAPTISNGVKIGSGSVSSINVNDADSEDTGGNFAFSVPSGWNLVFGGKNVATTSITRLSGSATASLTVYDRDGSGNRYYNVDAYGRTTSTQGTTRSW